MSEKKTKTIVKKEVSKKGKSAKETKTNEVLKEEVDKPVKKGREKKEKLVKQEKSILLSQKDQKYLRMITKFVSIVAKIIKICAMIIVPIILIVMILIPIMFKDVEFSGNIIRFNDARFVLNNDNITLNIGDKNYLVADGIKNMDKVIDFFNDNSIGKITTNVLLSLAFTVAIIIINIYIFQYIEKLFSNLYRHKTPYEDENCDYIRKIGRLMIINIIVKVVFDLILSLVFKNDIMLNTSGYTIMEIICVYVCYFIFLYGTNMQKKIDTQIYDKEI